MEDQNKITYRIEDKTILDNNASFIIDNNYFIRQLYILNVTLKYGAYNTIAFTYKIQHFIH